MVGQIEGKRCNGESREGESMANGEDELTANGVRMNKSRINLAHGGKRYKHGSIVPGRTGHLEAANVRGGHTGGAEGGCR